MDSLGPSAPGLTLGAVQPTDRVGRDGRLELRFEQRGSTTQLVRSRSTVPLQVLAPLNLDDPAAVVSVLNPTGGLVGGDRLAIEVDVGAGAHACLTTPSASKVYRTSGLAAEQHVALRVGSRATLEWVPEHTIPYAGSAMRQLIEVDLDHGARLIVVDAFAAGRVARGEAWQFASLEGAVRIRDRRGWRLYDRFVFDGEHRWDGLGANEGRPYFATIVVIGEKAEEDFPRRAEAVLAGHSGVAGAVGILARGGSLVRVLAANAPALLGVVGDLWAAARQAVLGLPPLSLRRL